jgi:hypothetical protein
VGIGELSLLTPCSSYVKYDGSTIEDTLYIHSHFNLEAGDSVVLCFNDNNQSEVYVRLTNKGGKLMLRHYDGTNRPYDIEDFSKSTLDVKEVDGEGNTNLYKLKKY